MAIFEYVESKEISKSDPSFYALLFALMRKADSMNAQRIKQMWPEEWAEMQARYDAPGGALTIKESTWVKDHYAHLEKERQ